MTVRKLHKGRKSRSSLEVTRRAKLRQKYRVFDLADITDDPTLCPICLRTGQTMHVDHDHSCCPGKTCCGLCVRGFICKDCNLGLGFFRDHAENLARAIAYLTAEVRA